MYLEWLSVENYRCFEGIEIELEPTGLTLIVGRNNVGKSALLSAIRRLFDLRPTSLSAHDPRRPTRIQARFQLDRGEREELLFGSKPRDIDLTEPIALWRTVSAQPGQEAAPQEWSVELPGLKRAPASKAQIPNVSEEQRAARVERIAARFVERFFCFDPIRTGSYETSTIHPSPSLRSDGSDLAEAIHFLLADRSPILDEIQAVLDALVPDAGRLATPPQENNQIVLALRDPETGEKRSIKELGTGVQELVMAAYAGTRYAGGGLLILEEPEAHLHAGAQRQLAGHLLEWAESRQIVMATHSPIFIDARGATRPRVFLVEREDGVSSVRRAEDDLPDVLQELGVRLSDVLSAKHVLVVEGPTDQAVLEAWFGAEFARHRVAVVAAQGGALSRHAHRVRECVEQLDQGERSVLFLRDRDELDAAELASLERKQVHVLGVRELENFLCDPTALRAVLPPLAWATDDDILAELRSIADSLKPRVLVKRLINRLRSVRLIAHEDADAILDQGVDAKSVATFYQERLQAVSEQIAGITSEWIEVERNLEDEWEERWLEIAPGEEMLSALFQEHTGKNFSKRADGPKLAAEMAPPPELAQRIRQFVGSP